VGVKSGIWRQRTFTTFVLALAVMCLGAVPAQAKRNLYVSGFSGQLFVHDVAPDGTLTPLAGSPLLTSVGSPTAVAITPTGSHLFLAGFGSAQVGAYAIGADGTLTEVPGSPFAAGSSAIAEAVSPDGKYLYITNRGAGNVSAYSIGADGVLTPLAGSPFAAGGSPEGIALTPSGSYAYVANRSSANVVAYSIGADGALTPLAGSPYAAGSGANAPVLTPDGQFLYVANSGANNVSGYRINVDGSLTPLPGFPVATGAFPQFTAISPDGRALFVANNNDETVSAYTIGPDGSLTPALGSPFTAGSNPFSAVASPDGQHLYVGSEDVWAYAIGAGAALAPIAGSPFASAEGPDNQSLAITPNQPPQARFTASVSNLTASFNAGGSSDPDGSVTRFDWSFGDGSTLPNGGPAPTHTYADAGRYDVSLTVTDNEGCSATFVFTGQTASCNGGSSARASQSVDGVCPVVKTTASKYKGAKGKRTAPGLRVKVRVSEAAKQQVRAVFKYRLDGKKHKVKFGKRTLSNSVSKVLKLVLPRAVRDELPLGTKGKLALRITSTSKAAPTCKATKSRLGLRAAVGKVPLGRR
jgi:6-phosphogluconolactonase (cycloisomerase 2 family)